MPRAGRPENQVWRCFGPVKRESGRKSDSRACKGCGVPVSNLSKRAVAHADYCGALHRQGLWRPPRMLDVITTMPTQHEAIVQAVARAVFSLNLPLRVVDHACFKGLVQTLRPGVKLPCAKTLGGQVLDRLFEVEWGKWMRELNQQMVTMCIDGWSSPMGKPVVGMRTAKHTFFFSSPTQVFASTASCSWPKKLWGRLTPLSSWKLSWTRPCKTPSTKRVPCQWH
jgi:hypothetical protein